MMSKGIGYMPMPEGFKYADLAKAGRPKHEKFDDFWLRHPPMDLNRRAKIFAPFTPLEGFNERIQAHLNVLLLLFLCSWQTALLL